MAAIRKTLSPVCAKPFVWIDTETTGLDPIQNDIIEIAIIRETDGSHRVIEARVKMERAETAHPQALKVNGYTEEGWADAKDPATFWAWLAETKILDDCIVAGHNVSFDVDFIQSTFARHGIKQRIDYHKFDTVTLALEHLKPWLRSVSLTPVCVALGIPTEGAHSAMSDCQMAKEVHRILTTATPEERATWGTIIPERIRQWELEQRS